MGSRHSKIWALGVLVIAAALEPAAAQPPGWPAKNITLIVPFSPGGGFDTQARIFAALFEKNLPEKVHVVVNNLKGAGGKMGSLALIKSAPDGYTIGALSPSSLARMQLSGELGRYDIRKLSYLGQLSWEDGVVVLSTASGFKTAQDLTRREVRIGVTDDSLFPSALLAKQLGLKSRMIMFEGSADEALAAMRGDIDVVMDSQSSMKRAVSNSQGKLLPLFTVADKRSAEWPEVPGSRELGLDLGDLYPIAGSARVLAAPAGMPAELLKGIQDAVWKALQDPEFEAKMEKAGYVSNPAPGSTASAAVEKTIAISEKNRDVLNSLSRK